MTDPNSNLKWYKVLDNVADLPEGRVTTVTAKHHGICLTHFEGIFSALDNKCPHQGGPLGEGSIENGLLRCPWHGWDYHPCTGKAPGFDDGVATYEAEVRDGAVYVGLPEETTHQTTISDIMVETMINGGVNTVFGMVGHSNLGLADAMRRQEKKGNLKFYGIRHEGAGAFAASAYGKLTGRPAACFAIAGPGSTNMFTGLWDAKVDRAPILALTGQVASQVVGTGNFQEVDLVRAFSTVASFNHRVLTSSKHSELMTLAIKHAILKRDVAHLTFPDEIQEMTANEGEKAQIPGDRITSLQIAPPRDSLHKAITMLSAAQRPVIIVGHGARFSMSAIVAFAESINCPVMTTFKAKGQISDHHPLGCGVLGRSGTPIASWFMNESDCILVLGASFSNHTGITDHKPTIQVDFDPLALSKFHAIDCQVWGEIGVTVDLLANALEGKMQSQNQTDEIAHRWDIWKAEKHRRLADDHGRGVSSIAIFETMNEVVPEDAVLCVDVGNNAYSLGRYYESKSNTFIMSGYLGSIGFAFPAALGAWAAVGDQRPVVAVAGDGGFCQYLADLTTAVKYNMNIKVIIVNNFELGKISKEQRAGEFDVWATDLHNPNFAEYAQGCGALGIKVTQKENLKVGMQKIMDHRGPALLEVLADVDLI